MIIYCCGCKKLVEPRLTNGAEIYPHRADLKDIPRWKCDTCGNHVGCHYKTSNPTRPLGCIPTPELQKARMRIHSVLDPLWKSGRMHRKKVYSQMNEKLGYVYHTADLKDLTQAERALEAAKEIAND